MCLYVSNDIHGEHNRKPFITPTPILVHKLLCNSNAVSGVSPYQGTRWYFGKEMSVSKFGYATYGDTLEVHQGLHAYRDQRDVWDNEDSHPAVIPVGAKIWIGIGREIVTNRMTVYRDMNALKKALNITDIAPGIPVESVTTWKTR
jgi:hypothetical protein